MQRLIFSATMKGRPLGPDYWICDCGVKERSKAKMEHHLNMHQAVEFATAGDELRAEAEEDKRRRGQEGRRRRWKELQAEAAASASAPTDDEPAEVSVLREQILETVEKARSEGYEQALVDVFGRGQSAEVMSLVSEMLAEHRAVQSL